MAKIKDLTIVTKNFTSIDGKHYYIVETKVEDKIRYGVIDHDNVDKDGRLKKNVNGIQMLLSETISELIERVAQRYRVNRLVDQGVNRMVASAMVVLNKSREEVEKMMNGVA